MSGTGSGDVAPGDAELLAGSAVTADVEGFSAAYERLGATAAWRVLGALLDELVSRRFGRDPGLDVLAEYATRRREPSDQDVPAWHVEAVLRAGAGEARILDGLDGLDTVEVLGLVIDRLVTDLRLTDPDLRHVAQRAADRAAARDRPA